MSQYVAICRIAPNNSLATFGDLGQGSAASVKVGMQRSTNPNRFSNKLSNRFPAYHLDPFVTQVYFVLWESMWYLEKMCGPFCKTEMIWYIYIRIYIYIKNVFFFWTLPTYEHGRQRGRFEDVRRLICSEEIHRDPTNLTDLRKLAASCRKVSGLGESLPPCLASSRWCWFSQFRKIAQVLFVFCLICLICLCFWWTSSNKGLHAEKAFHDSNCFVDFMFETNRTVFWRCLTMVACYMKPTLASNTDE